MGSGNLFRNEQGYVWEGDVWEGEAPAEPQNALGSAGASPPRPPVATQG